MAHKDFTDTDEEPIEVPAAPTFALNGHEFKCLPVIPGGALSDIFWVMQSKDITARAAGICRFISQVMPDEAADEFDLLIHDKTTIVRMSKLLEISIWLIEEYTSRPSTPSAGTPTGLAAIEGLSEGDSASPESGDVSGSLN